MENIVFCDLAARMYVGTIWNIPKMSGIFQGIAAHKASLIV